MTTDSLVEVTQKIVDILDNERQELGLAEIYYGDRLLIPEFPAVVCEGDSKDREIATTGAYGITLRVSIYIHHGKVQSDEANRKETEEFAEAVEAVLLENPTLEGLVIHGHVESMATGRTSRPSAMLRTTRLVFRATSRKNKP